ncbi:PREDICTED: LRR receptor-like serine/threonine-protein kinase GSO1 [Camelina sativa]|uniref:LRR receptor-like serine/threonine-protein kinase GSO1 n=1 Tax=Camelina sativa TaxID=90675 RepID=A0ABM1QE09_CAMSA|nr:PREDICTED: LRR receptor-like serine/threonine-protein kinase GSO1 [Camelina sativa]
MEGKLIVGKHLIWVMLLLLGQLHGYKSCIHKERNALLELKKYPIPINGSHSVLTTWVNDTTSDCCHWEGVTCNHTSGRVIGLSIDWMFNGKSHLLNLSLLHPFEDIRSLDLSGSRLNGLFDDVEGYKSLRRLRNLEILDLSFNRFNNSISPFLNAATSLTTLFLRSNDMDGLFHVKELKDLRNLRLLDLSDNIFNGFIPVRDLPALRKLKALDLHGNQLTATMGLQGICELKNLEELNLSDNYLEGQFPLCITRLIALRVLDLSSNILTGKLPSALGSLKSLEYLSLVHNDFDGFFSLGWLANLSELTVLKLSSKSNSLQVESDKSWKPKSQMIALVLRSCNLEKVPHFLLHQTDLRLVDLADNKITERFPSWLLANNTKLERLLLQNNSFTSFQLPKSAHNLRFLDVSFNQFNHLFPDNVGWILSHLQFMNLGYNGFQGNIPSSLGNMKSIGHLDLSHNSFHGKLPRSLIKGCYSLSNLKLSHNKLSGQIFPLPGSTNSTFLSVLSLDNNQFTGEIGKGLRTLKQLDLLDISYNNLTGVIPSWFDELPYISALSFSNNLLEGEIPISLFNISGLQLLDLSANRLSGGIPPHVNSTDGLVLLLQDNNLSGVIPDTLLANVNILDLSNNKLSGNIPEFVNTETIRILLLRGNNLTGRIPRQLCAGIQLLDLANNRLNGSIPSCLSNASFGVEVDYHAIDLRSTEALHFSYLKMDYTENIGIYVKYLLMLDQVMSDYYEGGTQTTIEFATKHRYDTYMGDNLGLLFGIDLSENELSSDIPTELGHLLKLHALNLSHNNLSGLIPESFSGLKNVESLDLSFNRLQGRIPSRLTDLSNLEVFDVSYNNLSEVIPLGRQFNTFDTQSYLGNPLLCGKPTNTSCERNNVQEPNNGVEAADESTTIDMESFYWSSAAAYVTILLGLLVSLSFDSPWSRVWFYNVDVFVHKVRNLLW